MTEKLCNNRYAQVEDNLKYILEEIHSAAISAGRNPAEIQLLAATKTVPADVINHAIACGVTLIGENRVQEWMDKRDQLHLDGVQAHFIGHLQTNKVNLIVGQVGMIESVDSVRLAQLIAKRSEQLGLVTDVLLEVNVGREESKSGFAAEMLADSLYQISQLSHIRVRGLMAIPPASANSAQIHKNFSFLHQLFIDIRAQKIDNSNMEFLSMGMSRDFREAIQEGAHIVRIGSALFGERR